jgi:putative two-component system response regulator
MESPARETVLIVDDTPANIDVLKELLRDDYTVKVALDGERALKIALTGTPPDIILLDVMMPGMDGYEVCRVLKADPRTRKVPIIFVTAKDETEDEMRGFELGAADYITKPISPPIVKARVRTQLELYDQNRALERKVAERTAELNETRLQIIRRLGRAAEYKDNETGRHVIRMSHYAHLLALEAGFDEEEAERLLNAAPMHDIGKIGVPDQVLRKPAGLDDGEWQIMHRHPHFGSRIIGEHDSELLNMAAVVATTHHEKWDGSGYPKGLAGEEIPLVGRITAIADVFDALTTARPYKPAWTIEKTMDLLREEAGKHFDPDLVAKFEAILPEVLKVREQHAEEAPEQEPE